MVVKIHDYYYTNFKQPRFLYNIKKINGLSQLFYSYKHDWIPIKDIISFTELKEGMTIEYNDVIYIITMIEPNDYLSIYDYIHIESLDRIMKL